MEEPIWAYWILLVGALMPYVLVILAKAGPAYDNADPRNPSALNTPFRRAAHAAHANSLEVFPLFAAAVLLAGFRDAPAESVNIAAVLWLVFRLAYAAFYLTTKPSLRSLTWLGATICSIFILVIAITQGGGAAA